MEKVRIGIIGIGNMGTVHANKFVQGECPECELTAVCDVNPDRLDWAKENLPETVARFDDATKMMESGLIDAVVVAVPHYFHPTLAIEAMKHHLHVMVEKPAGVYSLQVREMNEYAKTAGVTFGMMFNQRTNCVYRKMKELVDSGKYGQIRRANWMITNWYRPQAYYDSGAWRATWAGEGGGVLLNQCPHQLDMFQWICGMPKKVDAKLHFGKWHDIEVEDDVTAYMEFENGATGVFITSTGDVPGTNRFEITMDKAKLVVENDKLYMWELDVAEPEFSKTNEVAFAQPNITFTEVETDGENPQHTGVFNAFAANILHGTPLIANGEEGINGVLLSNAMHFSCFLDRPIMLPYDEALYFNELQRRVATSRRKENVKAVVADASSSFAGAK